MQTYREQMKIYNSRNYQSLLAKNRGSAWRFDLQQQKLLELTSLTYFKNWLFRSTIVEIIRAYQPETPHRNAVQNLQQQKLLELTSLRLHIHRIGENLQQQKLLELTSLRLHIHRIGENLQQQKLLELTSLLSDCKDVSRSTIVEIIRAYQPSGRLLLSHFDLQQQKLLELTSHP